MHCRLMLPGSRKLFGEKERVLASVTRRLEICREQRRRKEEAREDGVNGEEGRREKEK